MIQHLYPPRKSRRLRHDGRNPRVCRRTRGSALRGGLCLRGGQPVSDSEVQKTTRGGLLYETTAGGRQGFLLLLS